MVEINFHVTNLHLLRSCVVVELSSRVYWKSYLGPDVFLKPSFLEDFDGMVDVLITTGVISMAS